MPEHPRREAGRGVRYGVADRLRPGAHHRGVGPVPHLGGRAERVERRAFLLGESRRRRPAGGEHRGNLGRHDRRQVDVDAEQACRRLARHRAGDGRAPVAALGDVAGVAEALHQLRPGSRDAVGAPAGVRRLAGEAVARHRRQDEIERVLRASAMRGRIGERADGLEQLEHRAGPAMRHDQRQGVRDARADVDEVDVHAVDRRHELRQGVELGFGLSPVVAGAPILDERLELRELYALRLVIDRLPVGPARVRDAIGGGRRAPLAAPEL